MAVSVPDSHADLLAGKTLAHLACHLADGSVLVNPVWCLYEDRHVIVNSAEGRLKDRAMRRDPKVTLLLADPANPFRYLEIRGHVDDITQTGADDMIDRLAKKYLGVDLYANRRPGEVRVTYRIAPDKVHAFGS